MVEATAVAPMEGGMMSERPTGAPIAASNLPADAQMPMAEARPIEGRSLRTPATRRGWTDARRRRFGDLSAPCCRARRSTRSTPRARPALPWRRRAHTAFS